MKGSRKKRNCTTCAVYSICDTVEMWRKAYEEDLLDFDPTRKCCTYWEVRPKCKAVVNKLMKD